ncbi:MAG: flagellar biosynthetic protein FliO [Lachnospiraceae bacterium]|nr:flagellar biosynthetic protein FliO [Lachnospiraceae bacterium]
MADSTQVFSSSGDNFFRFLFALLAFIVVIVATYYVSKWIAGYQKVRLSAGNFEVVDSMRISANKYIMIVRIGRNKFFSVGVGKEEMVVLGEHSEDELIFPDEAPKGKSGREGMSFSDLLSSFSQLTKKGEHHED